MKAPTTSIIAGIALPLAGRLFLPDALRPDDASAQVWPVWHTGGPVNRMNPGTR